MILDYWNVKEELIRRNLKIQYSDLMQSIQVSVNDDHGNNYHYNILYNKTNYENFNICLNISVKYITEDQLQEKVSKFERDLSRHDIPYKRKFTCELSTYDNGCGVVFLAATLFNYPMWDYPFDYVVDIIKMLTSAAYFIS